jgi:diaminopimelate decarboxylase
LSLGCRLHVDNLPELETLLVIVNQIDVAHHIEIGLRLSTHTSYGWDRFGFDIDNGESNYAISKLLSSKVRLVGFHTHQSNIGTISEYEQHQSRIINYISRAIDAFQLKLNYVDLGSGFALQWPKPKYKTEWNIPQFSEYVETMTSLWNKAGFPENLTLVIEPGRLAVAPAGLLLAKVTNIKSRLDRKIVSVDAGHNLLAGAELFDYNVTYLGKKKNLIPEKMERYDVYGILCDSLDLLSSNIVMPETSIGDFILFNDVGGYDMARSFSWQIPRPAVIWLNGTKYKMIRYPENKEYHWLLNRSL